MEIYLHSRFLLQKGLKLPVLLFAITQKGHVAVAASGYN